jgi:hypothetical protein
VQPFIGKRALGMLNYHVDFFSSRPFGVFADKTYRRECMGRCEGEPDHTARATSKDAISLIYAAVPPEMKTPP